MDSLKNEEGRLNEIEKEIIEASMAEIDIVALAHDYLEQATLKEYLDLRKTLFGGLE